MLTKKLILVPIIATILASSPAIFADTESDMEIVREFMSERGFESNGFQRYVLLKDSARKRYKMFTTVGRNYAVIAVCDVDCDDVDLSIRDVKTDNVVATDYETDDHPLITFKAQKDEYIVRVDMEGCSSSAGCYVRVEAFGD